MEGSKRTTTRYGHHCSSTKTHTHTHTHTHTKKKIQSYDRKFVKGKTYINLPERDKTRRMIQKFESVSGFPRAVAATFA